MHGIYQCKHGVVHQRCRCINDKVIIVPCMIVSNGVLLHEACKEQETNTDLWR